jgi:Tat protein translocase TatB subunit
MAIVALVVLGPEKLPHAARVAGAWVGKIRRTVSNMQAEIEREVSAQEMRDRPCKKKLMRFAPPRKVPKSNPPSRGLPMMSGHANRHSACIHASLLPTLETGTPTILPPSRRRPQRHKNRDHSRGR